MTNSEPDGGYSPGGLTNPVPRRARRELAAFAIVALGMVFGSFLTRAGMGFSQVALIAVCIVALGGVYQIAIYKLRATPAGAETDGPREYKP